MQGGLSHTVIPVLGTQGDKCGKVITSLHFERCDATLLVALAISKAFPSEGRHEL